MHTIHPDLPAFDPETPCHALPVPIDDIGAALWEASDLTVSHIAKVDAYSISYHGERWSPGNGGGTELTLVLLAQLVDGRWIAVEAWNDYTGWGCQDGSDVYAGDSRDDVIANGLTNDGRSALGLPLV